MPPRGHSHLLPFSGEVWESLQPQSLLSQPFCLRIILRVTDGWYFGRVEEPISDYVVTGGNGYHLTPPLQVTKNLQKRDVFVCRGKVNQIGSRSISTITPAYLLPINVPVVQGSRLRLQQPSELNLQMRPLSWTPPETVRSLS